MSNYAYIVVSGFAIGSKVTIKQDFIMLINGKNVNVKGLECFIKSVIRTKKPRYKINEKIEYSLTYDLELPEGNILTCGEDALLYLTGANNETI